MTEQPTVVVRGEAVREVPPEIASCWITVAVRDRDKQQVLALLTERAAVLRTVLDGYGDAIERRETGLVQVFPEVPRERRTVAYVGRIATAVTMSDFAVLGELMLRFAGMEQIEVTGPWWQLRPGSTAGAEARRAAIADALTRAREYAAAVGARVDRLIEISDEVAGGHPMAFRAAGGLAEASGGLTLDPQQQTVHASVVVRVAITEPDLSS